MSQDSILEPSAQGSQAVAGEDTSHRGEQAAGGLETASAPAAAQDDLWPSSSQTAQDSSAPARESPEADSPSAPADPDAQKGSTVAPNDGATVAPGASPFTARQVGAARKFGLAEEDLIVLEALGPGGRGLLDRLVRAESELGRRFSRLGRVEKGQGATGVPGTATGRAVAGSPVASLEDSTGGKSPATPAAQSTTGGTPVVPEKPVAPLAQELQRLRAELAGLAKESQEAQAARDSAAAERFFAHLDAEVFPQFGGGATKDLGADSPQRRSRDALLAKAAEIRRGHQAVHGGPMEVEESLREALSIAAPDAPAEAQRRRLARQLGLRRAGLLARPAGPRAGGELESPADRTARALEEWQSKKGIQFFQQ